MAGFTDGNMDTLTRSEVWSSQLKDILVDELMAMKYVNMLQGFPDGDQFTIPSIGQAEVDSYVEDTPVKYRAFDTGEFTFAITKYLQSGTYMTEQQKQDSFYASQLLASFVPKQSRAIMERVEADVLNLAMSQTASAVNAINGADHRWVGSGTNETMSVIDFAKARYSLRKANVTLTNLVAIVDPSVAYAMDTQTNLVNFSNNPRWEGIVSDGISTGLKFVRNIFGFDVYESNFLPDANETITATGGSALTTAAGKANIFFSAAGGDINPFMMAWRQMPKVDVEFNKDFQREEWVTTCRYGVKLYRPENLVVVLTDTDQIV